MLTRRRSDSKPSNHHRQCGAHFIRAAKDISAALSQQSTQNEANVCKKNTARLGISQATETGRPNRS